MDSCRRDIMSAVCRVNSGAGVVVLTDMFGGTPSNLALSCMNGGSVELDGESLDSLAPHRRIHAGVGMVQENKRVFKRRTVEANLIRIYRKLDIHSRAALGRHMGPPSSATPTGRP